MNDLTGKRVKSIRDGATGTVTRTSTVCGSNVIYVEFDGEDGEWPVWPHVLVELEEVPAQAS